MPNTTNSASAKVTFVHGDMGCESMIMQLGMLEIRRLEGVGDLPMARFTRF